MTKWNDAQDAYYDALSYITSKSPNAPRVRYDKIEYRGVTVKNVIFNNPATIVLWSDGTKTVVKCQEGDVYDPEKGLAMAISKKALGNKGNFNEVFKKWLPKETALEKALANLRQTVKKCMSSLTLPSIDIEFRMNKEKENVESEKM